MLSWGLPRRSTVLGGALAGGAAGWALLSAADGGALLPVAMPLLPFVVVVLTARATPRQAQAVLGLVAVSPLVVAGVSGTGLADALGYANASAALAFVSAAAALVLALRTPHAAVRYGGTGLAGLWALLPWMEGAYAAGVLVGLLALVVWVGGRIATRRLALVGATSLVTALGVTVGLGLVGPSGGGPVEGSLGGLRLQLWADALEAIWARPWLGVGPGRFVETSSTFPHEAAAAWAHSEYLEWTVETGLPGGLLLVGLVLWMLAVVARSPAGRGGALIAVALTGVAVHATIDYVLHFPVLVIAVSAMVGVAGTPAGDESVVRSEQRARELVTLGALLLAAAVVLVVPTSVLNPRHRAVNRVAWTAPAGLSFVDGAAVAPPPRELYERLVASGAFTVEVVAAPSSITQEGPARIVSLSASPTERSLTLGQSGDALVVRVRTGADDPNGTDHEQRVRGVFAPGRARHVVVGYGPGGLWVYVDGRPRLHAEDLTVDLRSWEVSHPLVVGNETGGGRGWQGTLSRLAIHDRLLPREVVARRGPEPVVLYRFEQGEGRVVPDVGARPPEVDLAIPAWIDSVPRHFGSTLLDLRAFRRAGADAAAVGGLPVPVVRVLGHLVIFGVLGGVLAGRRGAPPPGLVVLIVVGFAVALEYGQFLRAGSASVVDVVAALAAAAAGAGWTGQR